MPKRKSKKSVKSVARSSRSSGRSNFALSVIALILNLLILPGLGTLVAGRFKTGSTQLIVWLIGAIALTFAWNYNIAVLYVGTPIVIVAWIWGIVTGINLIQESR